MLRGTFLTNRHAYIAADEPCIFHCHHYNTYLQAVIEDTSSYLDVYPILIESSQEIAYTQFTTYFEGSVLSISEKKQIVEEYFSFCGFGLINLADVNENGGKVNTSNDHYGIGWKSKFDLRDQKLPGVSFFTLGYIIGALEAIYSLSNGSLTGKQIACISKGEQSSTFNIYKNDSEKALAPSPAEGKFQVGHYQQHKQTPVDYLGIRNALTAMPIEGNQEEGLIYAFGVMLTRMYANYYCLVSYRFLKLFELQMGNDGIALASELLTEAGHVCAYNTFGGIMQSAEWYGLILPMLKTQDDWVHGIIAAVNALGWGIWEIEELIPKKKLVLKVTGGYEANSFMQQYAASSYPVSFLAKGGAAGIMNLIYHSKLTQEPISLDESTYQSLFKGNQGFVTQQTKCRAMGDDYDLFEVNLK